MEVLAFAQATDVEREWCAHLMESSDPWKTLGRSFGDCMERLSRPGHDLVVARRERELCGFILMHPAGVAGSPYIATLAIAHGLRGKGLGTMLLDHAEGYYPEARHIFLCVSSFNPRAQRLYERHGYAVVGELTDYVIPGASEILMYKKLSRR